MDPLVNAIESLLGPFMKNPTFSKALGVAAFLVGALQAMAGSGNSTANITAMAVGGGIYGAHVIRNSSDAT